jgi:AcrR family transcriptional regulator
MTRQKILEAAAQIFSQKGYHATSMSDIASAVNLQKASLYHHVNSKQEILLSLLDEALEMVTSRISKVIACQAPSDEKLRLAIYTYLKTLIEQRDLAAILLLEHRSLSPDLHNRHVPRRDRFEQLWKDLLRSGVDERKFSVQNIPLITRGLLGVMNWVVTWYQEGGELAINEISNQYADMILNGIIARDCEDEI